MPVESELRSKGGEYKTVGARHIDKEITKAVKVLYNTFESDLSYDALHLIISDVSFMERVLRIRKNT